MNRKIIGQVQWIETGVIIAMISIVLGLRDQSILYYKIAFCVLLLVLIRAGTFKLLATMWFSLSHWLGKASSFTILILIYFTILLPMAVLRQLLGRDQLKLNEFKKNSHSVFTHRGHRYSGEDLLHPY